MGLPGFTRSWRDMDSRPGKVMEFRKMCSRHEKVMKFHISFSLVSTLDK